MPQTLEQRRWKRTPTDGLTRALLWAGVVAGPTYVTAAAGQALSRDGFDIRRHAISLLSNGEGGWIQVTNFVVTGILTTAAAVGARRRIGSLPGGTWWPRLIAGYGLSLIAAGVLVADPALGFPPGAPAGAPSEVTWQGLGHFMAGGVGFLAVTGACLVSSRVSTGGWALFSAVTGAAFLASFLAVASGTAGEGRNVAFTAAVTLVWAWLSLATARMLGSPSSEHSSGAEL